MARCILNLVLGHNLNRHPNKGVIWIGCNPDRMKPIQDATSPDTDITQTWTQPGQTNLNTDTTQAWTHNVINLDT